MALSRSDLLQKYSLTEQTLVQLEALADSPLMDGDLQTIVRGRVMYEVTPDFDLFLRAAAAHYSCLRGPVFPCHRAILYLMISEADVQRACQALRGRGIIFPKVTDHELAGLWKDFIKKVPADCLPYLTGQSNDDSLPIVKKLLGVLDIQDMLADPERVMEKSDWLNSPELRILTDAFLAAGSDTETIRKYLSQAYRFDVTDDSIREYRRYFFDTKISGRAGIAAHIKSSNWSLYRSSVGNAANDGSVGEVVADLKLNPLIDARVSLAGSLRNNRTLLVPVPSRKTGMMAQATAFKTSQDAYYLVNALERTEVENNSGHSDVSLELLKLKHNQEINTQQMSVQDLPKEVRDAVVAGALKAKS